MNINQTEIEQLLSRQSQLTGLEMRVWFFNPNLCYCKGCSCRDLCCYHRHNTKEERSRPLKECMEEMKLFITEDMLSVSAEAQTKR